MIGATSVIPDSWEERELAFVANKGAGQLTSQRNQGEDLRPTITHHANVLGTKVYGAVNKVIWGTYEDLPACLLVVRFQFLAPKGLFRLRKATITICFSKNVAVNPHTDTTAEPEVCVYSPKHIYGLPTSEEREFYWEAALQCSVSVGPVDMDPELTMGKASKFSQEHALEIGGSDEPDFGKQLPNKVIFEVDENDRLGKGVPRELYFGVVVHHDGNLQADITTSIGDATAWPWSRDDPIILTPGKSFGSKPDKLSTFFDQLSDRDWAFLVPYHEERKNVAQGKTR